ncbi:hypothetical protein PRZ48_010751 [Zasmidium cellare]|uniref:GA4 desaturase n=1 Tax=Zasmidium cellare TaxID=395010 RepID=A0ABR0E9I2_ZASCE|nr:hypothetical protein PRZ48_010751 [Zasmidium cellare]
MAPTTATLRFGYPDLSVPDEERSFLNIPAPKGIENVQVRLHDASKDTSIAQGAKGLDVQGFAYVKHHSSICEDDGKRILLDRNVEEIYFPETEKLICELTGAKKAIIVNGGVRSGLAVKQEQHSFVNMKGSKHDQAIAELPRDVPLGKVHIDYTLKGVRDAARYLRKDIKAMAQPTLDAEDAGEHAPRYAMYSVWRPLKPVKRDPLVVCDYRTIDQNEIAEVFYRSPSDVCDEYLASACMVLPPKDASKQKWYWMPEQTPDDVLIIKLGDMESDVDAGVAGGIPHVSPVVNGTEDIQEARSSIEVRVLAFW